jgi:hypothetical protein
VVELALLLLVRLSPQLLRAVRPCDSEAARQASKSTLEDMSTTSQASNSSSKDSSDTSGTKIWAIPQITKTEHGVNALALVSNSLHEFRLTNFDWRAIQDRTDVKHIVHDHVYCLASKLSLKSGLSELVLFADELDDALFSREEWEVLEKGGQVFEATLRPPGGIQRPSTPYLT